MSLDGTLAIGVFRSTAALAVAAACLVGNPSDSRAASPPAIQASPEDPSIRILAVGSNRSYKPSLKSLRFAGNDATRFGHVMAEVGLVQTDAVAIVNDPTVAELRKELQRLAALPGDGKSNALQKFIFYFSGHSDADGIHLRDGAISKAELHRSLANVKSRSKIAILDSCFSGNLAAKGIAPDTAFEIPKAQFDEPSGSVFLAAASENQFAFESDTYRGSVFTHHLVKGLYGEADGNGDGVVTVDELYQHVYRLTRIQALTGPTRQEPSMAADLKGRGAIAMSFPAISMGKLALASDIKGVVTFASSRGLQTFQIGKAQGQEKTVRLPAGDFTVSVRDGASMGSAQIAVRPSQRPLIRLADLSWSTGGLAGAGTQMGSAKGSGPGDSAEGALVSSISPMTNRVDESPRGTRFSRDLFAGIHTGYGTELSLGSGPFAGVAYQWSLLGQLSQLSAGPGVECQLHQNSVGQGSSGRGKFFNLTAPSESDFALSSSSSVTSGGCFATVHGKAVTVPLAAQFLGGYGQTAHSAGSGTFAAGPGGFLRFRLGASRGLGVWIQKDWTKFKRSAQSVSDENFTAWSGGVAYQY